MAEGDRKAVYVRAPSDREVNMKRLAAAFGSNSAQMMNRTLPSD